MLAALIVVPLLGALAALQQNSWQSARRTALRVAVVEFALSLALWAAFHRAAPGYQWQDEVSVLYLFRAGLGIDGTALLFIVLTTFTTPLALLASWADSPRRPGAYAATLLTLEAILVAAFAVRDLILFYVAFEAALIPLFVLVGLWGSGPARVRAAFLLFLYTLLGSLLMLLAFIALARAAGTTDLEALRSVALSLPEQRLLWLGIFISLAVKTPLAPFHLWLFRAHAEGNAATSMILAGLILKLAVYGFVRVLIPLLPEATAYFAPLAQALALGTVLFASLATLRQTDFKALVAMSSVAHMAIVVLGLFSNRALGVQGALFLSLAHGLVSPALFFLVGGVLYARFHDRTIRYYRGLANTMPLAATALFLATLGNMATPSTANWIGELQALGGAFQAAPLLAAPAALSIVLSAGYSIWLFNRLAFGGHAPTLRWPVDLTRREAVLLAALLVPMFALGLYPAPVLEALSLPAASLLYSAPRLSRPPDSRTVRSFNPGDQHK
jgi:NADH-ubiquinone oxidoreductase chain 4